jgi:hypothetical protein
VTLVKKIAVGVCIGLVTAATVAGTMYWHAQRRAAAANLLQADEAIRALDEHASEAYAGGDPAALALLDLNAQEKMKSVGTAHLTTNENACAVELGLALDTAEARASSAIAIYRTAVLEKTPPDLSAAAIPAEPVTACVRDLQ